MLLSHIIDNLFRQSWNNKFKYREITLLANTASNSAIGFNKILKLLMIIFLNQRPTYPADTYIIF